MHTLRKRSIQIDQFFDFAMEKVTAECLRDNDEQKIRLANLLTQELKIREKDLEICLEEIHEYVLQISVDKVLLKEHENMMDMLEIQSAFLNFNENKKYFRGLIPYSHGECISHENNMEELIEGLRETSHIYGPLKMKYKNIQESLDFLVSRHPFLEDVMNHPEFIPVKSFYCDDTKYLGLKKLFKEAKSIVIASPSEDFVFSGFFSLFPLEGYGLSLAFSCVLFLIKILKKRIQVQCRE